MVLDEGEPLASYLPAPVRNAIVSATAVRPAALRRAEPIVPRNNQDHIGLSRIRNINFKLSRWHRSRRGG